ncbi:EamA family transporter [Mesorhizobium sp.]|uniref:DMT family transporter n=2 Tax=Mesorhizobium sp. TaxID=1871066 RepID=UPI000FEA8FC2|nr:EamA family transporter [Mesorhizobium sp.]RWM20235.1 MAG: EamA family transporter [Mesorhizobium sp.]
MGEILGVFAALLSSALGGTSIGATRYLVATLDPLAIGAFRFSLGFLFLLPIAIGKRGGWPPRRDWPGITGLGLLFFALFPVLFNASLIFTTAARGALALSMLPLLTLLVGALLRVEQLTKRKTAGVLIAMLGVGIALLAGLAGAPPGAWRGDLIMVAAAFCMALYSIWSKPFIRRCGPIPFTTMAMAVGATALLTISWTRGSFQPVATLGTAQWLAVVYLGLFGAALTFFLWAFALERTAPTRVAISVTVNPITAALVGAVLLGEPLGSNLAIGIAAVFTGIWMATTGNNRSTEAIVSGAADEPRPGSGS